MVSCTKLGNASVRDSRKQIMRLYAKMSSGTCRFDFQSWLTDVLEGRVEFTTGFARVKRLFPFVFGLGTFKLYYIGKCLRSRVPTVVVRKMVGTNLEPERESGAFNLLFARKLAADLSTADLIALLAHIEQRLVALLSQQRQTPLLASICDLDVTEHACCEYVKACRIRDKLRAQQQKVCKGGA